MQEINTTSRIESDSAVDWVKSTAIDLWKHPENHPCAELIGGLAVGAVAAVGLFRGVMRTQFAHDAVDATKRLREPTFLEAPEPKFGFELNGKPGPEWMQITQYDRLKSMGKDNLRTVRQYDGLKIPPDSAASINMGRTNFLGDAHREASHPIDQHIAYMHRFATMAPVEGDPLTYIAAYQGDVPAYGVFRVDQQTSHWWGWPHHYSVLDHESGTATVYSQAGRDALRTDIYADGRVTNRFYDDFRAIDALSKSNVFTSANGTSLQAPLDALWKRAQQKST